MAFGLCPRCYEQGIVAPPGMRRFVTTFLPCANCGVVWRALRIREHLFCAPEDVPEGAKVLTELAEIRPWRKFFKRWDRQMRNAQRAGLSVGGTRGPMANYRRSCPKRGRRVLVEREVL